MHFDSCWPNPSIANMNTKCVSTCVDQTNPMPVRTQNVSEHVLTQPLKCQRGHKIHLTMCCPIPSYAWEDTKCPSTCVDETRNKPFHARDDTKSKTPPFPVRTRNIFQPLNCHRWQKSISTHDDQTTTTPAKTQNVSQLVLTKSLPCLRVHKMQLNMCWPNLSYASKDKIHLDICWPNTSMPARTEDGSHHVDYIPFHAS